jgi:hypothetical protein
MGDLPSSLLPPFSERSVLFVAINLKLIVAGLAVVVVAVVVVAASEDAALRRLGQLDVLLLQHEAPQLLQQDLDGVLSVPAAQYLHDPGVDLQKNGSDQLMDHIGLAAWSSGIIFACHRGDYGT